MLQINCICHVESVTRTTATTRLNRPKPLGFNGEFTFVYTYPLSHTVEVKRVLTPEMTAVDLVMFGKEDYKRIYREEDAALKKPAGKIPGMINRAKSNGPHGIWGHDIGDLFFEGIKIDGNTIKFDMGS